MQTQQNWRTYGKNKDGGGLSSWVIELDMYLLNLVFLLWMSPLLSPNIETNCLLTSPKASSLIWYLSTWQYVWMSFCLAPFFLLSYPCFMQIEGGRRALCELQLCLQLCVEYIKAEKCSVVGSPWMPCFVFQCRSVGRGGWGWGLQSRAYSSLLWN